MKQEWVKKLLFCSALFLIVIGLVNNIKLRDTIKYNGKTYVLLEYNRDVFYYTFNNSTNEYYEVDEISPVKHSKWDMIYFNGDIFVLDNQAKSAINYYSDDENYQWFIMYEENDHVIKKVISINEEELDYIYDIENVKEYTLATFEQINQFVDIVKISDDHFTIAIINLVQHDGYWYWKTEKMNDNNEEYIVPLPKSLNNKIFDLLMK